VTFDTTDLVAYVNGDFVPAGEASISIFDHGLLYGDGCFEGLRVFDGALFRPRDHIARLGRSARALAMDVPLAPEELLAATVETVRRCGLRDAHVRILLTRGFGTPGLDPARCERPTLIVAAYPFPPHLGTQPLRLVISSVVRKAPRSLGAHVKSLNYLDAVVAFQQAKAAGANDAIMLDHLGAVAETTGANLFAVFDGTLVTPTTRAALPGITRRTILELAAEQGVPAEVRDIWPMDLYAADAAFVTGSGASIVPIGEIDGRPLASAGHPLLEQLVAGYRARTADAQYRVPIEEPVTAA
jgi:branched-chain amino acid aminotransferase